LGAYRFLESTYPSQKKKIDWSQQGDLVAEYELLPALIIVLACELVEAQNLARARILPPPYELLLALILVAAQIPVLPMIIVLACELIEAQNLRGAEVRWRASPVKEC
jgi:hypothetical protein